MQDILPPLLSAENTYESWTLSGVLFLFGEAAFQVSSTSTMLVLGLRLHPITSDENCRNKRSLFTLPVVMDNVNITCHVWSLGESHSYPSLCLPLHDDVQVARVASVGINSNVSIAFTWFTARWLSEGQSIFVHRSHLINGII